MTATYTLDPSNVPVDALRLYIGDTDVLSAQFQDEELEYFLSLYQVGVNPTQRELINAAIDAVRTLLARVDANVAEEQTGQERVRVFERKGYLLSLIAELEKRLARRIIPAPYAGGISKTTVCNNKSDPDRVNPVFEIGMISDPSIPLNEYDD